MERPSIRPSDLWDRLRDPKNRRRLTGSGGRGFVAGSAVLGVLVATGAVVAAGPWDSGQRKAERDRVVAQERTGGAHHGRTASGVPEPAPSAPAVLTALGGPGTRTASRDAAGLTALLGPLLNGPALGSRPTGAVIDTATGERLYGQGTGTPMTPASTVKIATTVAALRALGPDHRIATTVRASADSRTLTLVGGGDPTLARADLRRLAAEAVDALREQEVSTVALTYDTSRYTGPPLHPIGPNENIAPVSALMIDEGRLDGSSYGPAPRTADPAGDAAHTFAGLLDKAGIGVEAAPTRHRAPAKSRTVATHRSKPLSALVERALTNSDNDIAEALVRETALATGERADFAGGRRAVTAQLKKLGLPTAGANLADGSGLDRADRVSAALLAGLLAVAADPAHPELRPVLTGLPVAGFNGTLKGRYSEKSRGTGLIRAKTGTLTGVNTLAGTVVDTRGRLLAFAFLATGTTSPSAAQSALDTLATTLVEGPR
ncbi:D-alanyl-D-alanine carboxypeptidase/D-alanyl-D-alanine-endopeptidase (penicillin-binding protein 4) [Streptomyces fulvorobeus]|uniref:D-alanyl-D-alanine carboxypeptidase/D-alanyl-D-alanine-endopeptidase (Penicillin-binding protein 4) n=1 Tax=Streptomyces fulvorobeus TaxID=284028 RepID=A0A7Y9HBL4_9ACTN|nr:D-alanyl-D-alanine carboxypeptidase/D-alanyl-D-alanine-endopeptidase (penicillin-binding protein 4) [Streptomyces fulvorobeus]